MVRLTEHDKEEYANHIVLLLKDQAKEQFRKDFLELHPTDQMEIFDTLDAVGRKLVYDYLQPAEFAEIFQEMDIEKQKVIAMELNDTYLAEMFNNMYADDIADFLAEIKEAKARAILGAMDKEDADDVKELLSYPPETAGAIMTKEFIAIRKDNRVADVIIRLRKEGPDAETIYYLYVVDDKDKLVGVVSLRDLIISPDERRIEEIMSTRVVSVEAHLDQEEVANLIKKYDFLAAPVVTSTGELIGIVTIDDVMDVVHEETEEDFGEIAAVRGSLDANISAFAAAKKRAPWIIILMFLGLITAGVINGFEETLSDYILLALFIPLIMGSAGNTGTQALAVVVRGLSVGTVDRSTIRKMLKREFGTGILLGIICAITLLIVVPIVYPAGGFLLAVIVGLSLFITLCFSTMVGATIPLIINKLKIDPAVASGPFITTINDIMGLMIYFSVATALLDYLPNV